MFRQCPAQESIAEHLRCLGLPQTITRHRCRNTPIAIGTLKRIGYWNGKKPAYRVVGQTIAQSEQSIGSQAWPGGIMHQQPIVLPQDASRCSQTVCHALGPRRTTATLDAQFRPKAFPVVSIPPFVACGEYNPNMFDALAFTEHGKCVIEHRPAGQSKILLWYFRPKTRAASGSGDES